MKEEDIGVLDTCGEFIGTKFRMLSIISGSNLLVLDVREVLDIKFLIREKPKRDYKRSDYEHGHKGKM